MRTEFQLLALLATLVAGGGGVHASLEPAAAAAAQTLEHAMPTGALATSLDRATPQPDAEPTRDRHALAGAVKQRRGSAVIYMPTGFWMSDDGAYDLVLHFHGGSHIAEPQLERSGLNAVLVTVNLGIGSRSYRERFERAPAFEGMLESINQVVETHGPLKGKVAKTKRRRLALSSWSAGYGAIGNILSRPQHRDLVDAVFMSDGIHGAFFDKRARKIADIVMEPYVHYAQESARDNKIMRITHSQILTYGYASTTETARYMIKALGLAKCTPEGPDDMKATSCHGNGNVRITGFEGDDKPAHCDHMLNMDELVLAPLRARWLSDRNVI